MISLKSKRPIIISGPCSAETQEQLMETCKELAATGVVNILRAGIWKPRTRPGNFEGHGEEALKWYKEVKKETSLPIATEVANSKHVELALKYGVDVLWIGARTTVNPFSVQEIADSLRGVKIPVLIKNPINPDIDLWQGAVQRIHAVGIDEIGLIHRGFSSFVSSKYRNNPLWDIAIEMKRRMDGMPFICDPSHICGSREFLYEVSQKSADLSYDGLIIESHINPKEAWSDASQQLIPSELANLVKSIIWREPDKNTPEYIIALDQLRSQIDTLDNELYDVLGRRMEVSRKIGQVKKDNNVAILQTKRWSDILGKAVAQKDRLNLSEEFITKILEAVHVESINTQNEVMNKKD